MKELYKKGSCVRKGLYESFTVENPTGAVHLKITFSSEPFPVTYGDLLPEERCLDSVETIVESFYQGGK